MNKDISSLLSIITALKVFFGDSLVRRAKAKRKGEKFDEKLDKQLVEMIETLAEKESLALSASSMVTDDGIIDPRDTRNVLGFSLSISDNNLIKGADGYGVFRL